MKIISIITARSGSKGVPHKNIRNLGGIPLLGWTIKAASKSKLSNKIILSTDSEEYFKIASSFNDEIIFSQSWNNLLVFFLTRSVSLLNSQVNLWF